LHDRLQQPWTEFFVHKGAINEKNKTKKKEEQVIKMKKTKKSKLNL